MTSSIWAPGTLPFPNIPEPLASIIHPFATKGILNLALIALPNSRVSVDSDESLIGTPPPRSEYEVVNHVATLVWVQGDSLKLTLAQIAGYTGRIGQIAYCIDTGAIYSFDGVTVGGLEGGGFKPDWSTLSFAIVNKWKDIVSARDGGAGQGNPDDHLTLQSCMDYCATYKKSMWLPGPQYLLTYPVIHRQGVTVFGDGNGTGSRATKVTNTYTGADPDRSCAWIFGTYGPGNGARASVVEAAYTILVNGALDNKVNLLTPIQANNFAVGDLVCVSGGDASPGVGMLTNPNGIFVIRSINAGTGVITFTEVIPFTFSGSVSSPQIRKLNTGNLAGYGNSFTATTAYALIDAALRDISITANGDGLDAINLSAYRCLIERVTITGRGGLIGNPFARTIIKDTDIFYRQCAIETAYLCHNNLMNKVRSYRVGDLATNNPAIWDNAQEGARNNRYFECELHDLSTITTYTTPSLWLQGTDSEWTDGKIFSSRGAAGQAVLAQAGSKVARNKIVSLSSNGVACGSNVVITDNIVNAAATFKSIVLQVGITNTTVRNNKCGPETGKSIDDAINNLSGNSNNIIENNKTYYSKDSVRMQGTTPITGTLVKTTVLEMDWLAGQVRPGFKFGVNFTLRTAGNVAAKTIRIETDAGIVATIVIPASAATQTISINGYLVAIQGSGTWSYSFDVNISGTYSGVTGNYAADIATSTALKLTAQLADITETIIPNFAEINQIIGNSSLL